MRKNKCSEEVIMNGRIIIGVNVQIGYKNQLVIPIFGGYRFQIRFLFTWIIMAFLMILTLVFVRNLKMKPTGPANLCRDGCWRAK